jgi:hypothetical protein
MRRTILFSLVGLFAIVNCGGGDDDGGGGQAPAAKLEPQITSLASTVCDVAFRCCARGEVDWYVGPYIDKAHCAARFVEHASLSSGATIDLYQFLKMKVTVPNVGALDRAQGDGRIKLDEKALTACVGYLAGLPCNAYKEQPEGCVPPEPPPEPTPCDPKVLFTGQLREGARCTSSLGSLECKAGLGCRTDDDLGVYGTCVHVSDVGEPCVTDGECADLLYCSQLDGTCQKPRIEGETCLFANRDDPNPPPETALIRCRADLSCDPLTDTCVVACQRGAKCEDNANCDKDQDLICIQKRCDLKRIEGLPCETDVDCEKGLRCDYDKADPTKKVCSQRLPLNSPCTSHAECAGDFCDPTTGHCAAPLAAGSLCPTGINEQCFNGRCVEEGISCTADLDCPSSKKCNLAKGECAAYCVALLPDGAPCGQDSDCDSGDCVASFCRTTPLANGVECDQPTDCDSEFCSLDAKPVCKELPLPLGDPCSSSEQCDSLVCFSDFSSTLKKTCVSGLEQGEQCGQTTKPPCDPKKFYCDTEEVPSICVPLKEVGEACESDIQCRGTCTLHPTFNRTMCDPTPAPKTAICDGTTVSSGTP